MIKLGGEKTQFDTSLLEKNKRYESSKLADSIKLKLSDLR
jgi:hypothetical protein